MTEQLLSSVFYISLVSRVSKLESHFLPVDWDPLGDYTLDKQDEAKSCVLLVHAEIEYYFESFSQALADKVKVDIENGNFNQLSTYFIYEAGSHSNKLSKSNDLVDIAKGAVGLHKKVIKGNNGVKTEDIKKLFSPFGIDKELSLDPVFSGALDNFGTQRGRYAHLGTIGITKSVNCREVYDDINELIDYIFDFDSYFNRLLSE